ncbi:MAG: aminotransferase class I/II-fold pyridoxal phosphate-dependent enzyme [Acidobacteria bacterium]|nr:MAG: aminotransferase class I/II-fold pyridoxal phosphate-dependent enzyme [Acidobacteriota bacterium]
MSVLARRIGRIGSENAFKIGPLIAEVERRGHRVIRCNLGEPDFELPDHIREAVKQAIDDGMTHYVDPQGILPLREAVARHISQTRGIEVTPERVVVFPGGKPAIGLCEEAYVDPGDEVIYPSPGYPIYESFTGWVDARPVPLHLPEDKGFAFGAEELEPLITERTKLIVLCFPSNPTGGVATREQLEEIAEVILRKAPADVRIYSDEIYEHILFDGARHESIASIPGMAERTVIASGASKSYAWTGGRVGWAVFPTVEEAEVFRNLNINYFSCVPAYNQIGCKVAIESPETPPVIEKMVAAFQRRRDLVVPRLNEIDGMSCAMPRGAFYAFPNIAGVCERLGVFDAYAKLPDDVKAKTSPSTLFQMFLLFEHHVATVDRRSFGQIGTEDKHFIRLSIANADDELLEGVRRIADAADDREGFRRFVERGEHLF